MAFSFQIKISTLLVCALSVGGSPVWAADEDVSNTAMSLSDFPVCEMFKARPESVVCACPSGFDTGIVWGSGPYTGDSDVCTAALHSGLISEHNFVVEVISRGANESYPGSSSNGVTTRDWGNYGESFEIVAGPFDPDEGGQDADVAEVAEASPEVTPEPTPEPTPESTPVAAPAASPEVVEITETPDDAVASSLPECAVMPHGLETYTCSCPGGPVSGSVWGSGPYTADSHICTAANHAGLIGLQGAEVSLIRLLGLDAYTASERNQVQTRAWGSYTSSIVFNWN